MKNMVFLFSGSLWVAEVFSQVYDADALKFARQQTGGTARSMGVAGAFGSVGADLSATLTNPAGIALYRASEVSLGIGIHAAHSGSLFLNQERHSDKSRFSFNYFGFVIAVPSQPKNSISFQSSNLKFVNIALTYNRVSTFDRTVTFEAFNKQNVFAGSWVNELNGLNNAVPSFTNASVAAVLAYKNESIIKDSVSGKFVTYLRPPLLQSGSMEESGALDELNLALGFNVIDKVFFTVNAGIPFVSYQVNHRYHERDVADSILFFNDYLYKQFYRSNGLGFQVKLGVIFRPVNWYRGGIAFHSPTWLRLDENYYASLTENYNQLEYFQDVSFAPFRYRVTMPAKGILSNSFYLKNYGFLSVDYELQNFGAIRHHFREFDDMSKMVNNTVKNKYGFSHTLRLGAEGAMKWFRIRAGYAWQSSPFKTGVGAEGFDEQRHLASVGLGYRGKNFFADLAYQVMLYNTYHQPYQSGDGFEPAVTTRHRLHNFLITAGWRFSRN